MPRRTRLFLPNMPLHVVQRGHDRQPVFVQPRDYRYYLNNLVEMKAELAIQVYGYCLMSNHVHLIIAPGEDVSSVSRFMRALAGRQTRYVNKLENRTGTLWNGRFNASLIDSDQYLLCCCRYVDLNPVRAALVAAPENYEWSSYRYRAALKQTSWLDDHPTLSVLARGKNLRGSAYREFVSNGISDNELKLIRTALRRNQLTGNEKFQAVIEERTGRRVSDRGRGRPAGK